MARYRYRISEDKGLGTAAVQISDGASLVASSLIVLARQDFESYSVKEQYRGRGFSYALTHLMLLYCKDNGMATPTVSNAHGSLMTSLPKMGFPLVGQVRRIKNGKESAGSYQCGNVDVSLNLCKKKMIVCGLIAEGLQNDGPYKWKS
jgi:hypothetical protein